MYVKTVLSPSHRSTHLILTATTDLEGGSAIKGREATAEPGNLGGLGPGSHSS